jgi:exopolysaccharide biosynthesis polyprenyl glycosylphosphotransferase
LLGKHRTAWIVRLVVADTVVLGLAFGAAYALRVALNPWLPRAAGPVGHYVWLLGPLVGLWLGLLAIRGGYGLRWLGDSWALVRLVGGVSAAGLLLAAGLLFFLQESEVNRTLLLFFSGLSAAGLWGGRQLVRRWLSRGRAGRQRRHALVVGTDWRAARVVAALARYPEAGWVLDGCIGLEPDALGGTVGGVPVRGLLSDLPDLLQSGAVVDEVFFALPPERLDRLAEALEACESLGVDTRVLLEVYEPARARAFVERLFGLPIYGFSPTLTRQGALAVKRALDVVGALLGLAVLSPLLGAIAIAVRLTSRGPALFRQERVGFRGRRFWMYKFRTMVAEAELLRERVAHLNALDGPVFKAVADPRVTPLGHVLRRTSLDELPQLWNVLRGEMSLVGPRPLPLYEAEQLKGAQRRRLAMRPGITGLWLVGGRSMVVFEEWMALDLAYVDHWSLVLDLDILGRTVPAVLRGDGAL